MTDDGRMIGGFRILRDLKAGAGSQGTVYQAVCEQACFPTVAVGDVVALKVMTVQDDDGEEFARLEARTADLLGMNHPNVVKYHGCFRVPGLFNDVHVLVLEFVEGISLKERLIASPCGLGVDEAMRIALGLIDGLAYTSSLGIVHRDVKPGNVIVQPDGTPKLIDFEVARREGGAVTLGGGNMIGTFDYMAPDFTVADFRGDVLSDVFSMGVVLHEMLTGRTPYRRRSGTSSQANVVYLQRWLKAGPETDPLRVSTRIGKLLPGANELFERVLSPDRAKRLSDFAAFREELGKVRYRELAHGGRMWRLQNYIGHGGYGEVFGAVDRATGERVAVKHLLSAAGLDRFRREAQAMRRVGESCFPRFVDWFTAEDGAAFLVMEYLDGMPGQALKDLLRPRPGQGLERTSVLRAFVRYAHGLADLHALGFVHRDVKPSNLYFPPSAPERAAIMDLGIARDLSGTATVGQVPGTIDYMPPESVTGKTRGGPETDVWSLGLCLYEALTGKTAYPRLPEGAAGLKTCFERASKGERPDFSGLAGETELEALLEEMCEPNPENRIRDIRLVERRLRIALGEKPECLPVPAGDFVWKESAADADFTPSAEVEPDTVSTMATSWGEGDVPVRVRAKSTRGKGVLASLLVFLTLATGGFAVWRHVERQKTIRAAEQAESIRQREEALRLAEQERRKVEAECKAKEEAARKAKEEAAARKAKEEAAARKAKEEAARKAKEESARKAKEEELRKAKEEELRKAKEEAERKAKVEAERKAKEEAERKAKEEAARKAKEEAASRKAKEEAARKAKEEAARKAKVEAARKAKEEMLKKLDAEFDAVKREYEKELDAAVKPGSLIDPEKLQREFLVKQRAYRARRKELQEQKKPSERKP